MKACRKYTAEEDQFLKDNYLLIPVKRMSRMLGRCEAGARQRMQRLGIVVPPEVIERNKRESWIKQGANPPNKGKKLHEFVSPEGIERSSATRFKPGNIPPNTKADYVITTRPDKRGVPYQFIRVSLAKWMPLHRYNWQTVNGPIAPKMKLIFKDGDTMNCDVSNLELMTYADLMRRNSVHNLPKPLAEIVQLRGAIQRQINKHQKRLSDEK